MPEEPIFVVTEELQRLLDSLPADKPRSRLEPFRSFILRWRRQGRTYRRIQQILENECRVKVTHETIRRFIKRRARLRNPDPVLVEVEAQPVTMAAGAGANSDPYAEARERIRLHKAQLPVPKAEPLFTYTDEDARRPIVLIPSKKEEGEKNVRTANSDD